MAAEQEVLTVMEESNRGITSIVVPREVWEAIDVKREEREETRAEWLGRIIADALVDTSAGMEEDDGALERMEFEHPLDPNNGSHLWTLVNKVSPGSRASTPRLWTAQKNGFDLAVEEKPPGRDTGSGVSDYEWSVHLGWETIARGRYTNVDKAKSAAVFETRAWMQKRGLSHVDYVTPAYAKAYETYIENRNNGLVR